MNTLEKFEAWSFAEGPGGAESLVTHPAEMTHACLFPEEKKKPGIIDSPIR